MPSRRDARPASRVAAAPRTQTALHATELLLAGAVLLVAATAFEYLPRPYPMWPTVGPLPITPELVVPTLLGVAAALVPVVDGVDIGSVAIAALGAVTVGLGVVSLSIVYASTGGVFFLGLFTLASGIALAVAVVCRRLVRTGVVRTVVGRVVGRIEG